MSQDRITRTIAATAEQSVVGAILIDAACVGDVLTRVRATDFQEPRLRALFAAAQALYNERKPVDVVTVCERAGGGQATIDLAMDCMDMCPTAANVADYCEIVRDQAVLARIHATALALVDAPDLDEARELLAKAQGDLADRPGTRIVSLMEMMVDFFRRMGRPKPDYLHWGLGMLDDKLHTGPGSYVIIAARPSTGKTALALQLGVSIAQKKRVGFFSLETVPEIAGDRIAAANLDITLPSIKKRTADRSTLQALTTQAGRSEALQGDFEFISGGAMTVADIRTMALARRYDVVMIDYVQLIKPAIPGDRTEQMQGVSMDLRTMAQTTGLTIIALAQLRRPESQGKPKAPTMADLKESGQFEQDADAVLLMYLENAANRSGDRIIKIEKNKEGYAGFVARFRFDGAKQRFTYVAMDGKSIKAPKFEEIEEDGQMELPFG